MGQLPFAEMNDHDQRHLDSPPGGGDARQHPIHADGVRELEDELIDESIGSDGARDGSHLGVRGHLGNEIRGVELS